MNTWFSDHYVSHAHSLKTLETFYEFDDFMSSISTLLDLGCGHGLDMQWWATRTTRDLASPRPLNIRCTGVDRMDFCPTKHTNIIYRQRDFETDMDLPHKRYDVLWCHDAFQYVRDPYHTLLRWRDRTAKEGMLVLIVPQTTNFQRNHQQFELQSGCFYHWTLVNLMHILAVTGWDCRAGFWRKTPDDAWIHAVVYKSSQDPLPPGSTWYDIAASGLLPQSAEAGINRVGFLRQQDLVLPWLDKSLITYERY
jgi:SAM-dependent methyltransferase